MLLLATTFALAAAAPRPSPPLPHGCVAPHDSHPWCNASLPAAQRAALVVAQLTVPVIAMLGGVLLLGETLGLPLIGASLVVLGGVALSVVPLRGRR